MSSNPAADFAELIRSTQENLVTFLRNEVTLANTFLTIAHTTDDPAHHLKLLGDIEKAVSAIRHFGQRITDEAVRSELNAAADEVELLASAG